MLFLSSFSSFFSQVWHLTRWTDGVEIILISSLFYYFSLWLRGDRQKNLLGYFYSYCTVAGLAYATGLNTVSYLLFLFSPVTITVFILLHQQTLQKNFVLAQNITPAKQNTHDWLSSVIRTFFLATHHKKSIVCIIEKNDSLASLLSAPLMFHTPLQKDLLDILLASASFDNSKMVWINHYGELVAINAQWHCTADNTWIDESVHALEQWKQDAILLTNKTDSLVFKVHHTDRTIDLVAQNKIIDGCTMHEALLVLRQYLYPAAKNESSTITVGRNNHEQKHDSKQSIS